MLSLVMNCELVVLYRWLLTAIYLLFIVGYVLSYI